MIGSDGLMQLEIFLHVLSLVSLFSLTYPVRWNTIPYTATMYNPRRKSGGRSTGLELPVNLDEKQNIHGFECLNATLEHKDKSI